jgi:hypothetical protein
MLCTRLQDFYTFLLIKEQTHFTSLSFATTYPGLVHFVYLDSGIMISPLLVDLNEMDKNHELLHEVYGKYNIKPETAMDDIMMITQHKWMWPTVSHLKLMVR